ncbi:MAG TPA: AmmeMemoRadiSam system radical SAM enzyme [Bacteroidales bacterium]|jgi:pyruvate formate lyase activating enzyme|nr:AmmeMemoRadiSam system radical SAM enzyme [Bacteroidales bacterium]OQB65535.1 MAG: Pyruvate formate-lyase 1-activating enzyme [Bacteroidetes bacterium ADurb.Bin145]NMD03583.1 AmmeMemoRadiSam system radical SAM enzyme [Bacteroidales bacterium]HOU01075.1 AmmeMemoRadiSam system radical SAM enzyme [Bacteroidales bacterium]HQG62477.1 AmmeMemoRadiSam system radical SAM enzyme [Bacteroidales bacterium]
MGENDFDQSKRSFLKKCLAFSAGLAAFPYPCSLNAFYSEDESVKLKEALFQEETPRGIMCRICPNECVLKEGEISQCNNRKVKGSRLFTMAFGNPCSANIDPVEKKPLYHFFPGTRAYSIATAGCNLACLNCQNWTISQSSPDKTRNYDLMPEKVVNESVKNKCRSIAYTYSEPISFYEYVYETSLIARKSGVKNIVKSNGYINAEPLKKWCSVIDAANIDLKSFNDSTYLKLSGGKLQPVLDSLKIYRDSGVWLEITHLIIPRWTDKTDEIGRMCKWLGENGFKETPLHFSRFYPTYKLEQLPPTPVDILRNAAKIASGEGIKYVYIGNVPGNEMADTRCPSCGTIVVSRQGFTVTSNNLTGGKCNKCGKSIDGVWS